VANGPLWA